MPIRANPPHPNTCLLQHPAHVSPSHRGSRDAAPAMEDDVEPVPCPRGRNNLAHPLERFELHPEGPKHKTLRYTRYMKFQQAKTSFRQIKRKHGPSYLSRKYSKGRSSLRQHAKYYTIHVRITLQKFALLKSHQLRETKNMCTTNQKSLAWYLVSDAGSPLDVGQVTWGCQRCLHFSLTACVSQEFPPLLKHVTMRST